MSAKIENDCFDSPRTTISCARLCCASAKEGYSYVFSDAYRPDTVFELRNSNGFELLLYRRPVRGGGAGGAVFGGIRRLNPDFRKPTPSAEIAVRMGAVLLFHCLLAGPSERIPENNYLAQIEIFKF